LQRCPTNVGRLEKDFHREMALHLMPPRALCPIFSWHCRPVDGTGEQEWYVPLQWFRRSQFFPKYFAKWFFFLPVQKLWSPKTPEHLLRQQMKNLRNRSEICSLQKSCGQSSTDPRLAYHSSF
jgi:hypothetical protein